MELSKKTTILFPPDLHDHLVRLAKRTGTSLGGLVRSACVSRYGLVSGEERVQAIQELRRLRLPVATPRTMKRQTVPRPKDLLP